MTIYTVTLIELQVRTNEPEVHVFTNKEAGKQFAFIWMQEQSSHFGKPLTFQEMLQHCTDNDICIVEIQSHQINLPTE